MTLAGCYEMYEVLKVGGITFLEAVVLVLFVLLFAWIAFSFTSALAGFAVLLVRQRDPLGIDPDAPLPVANIFCDETFRRARVRALLMSAVAGE